MIYKQFDKRGKEISHIDLQAKKIWCKKGEKIEEVFIHKFGKKLNLKINPEKTTNPYAPDLMDDRCQIADLKTQNTPFFKAEKLYKIDPSYAVVFNRKDAERYWKKYRSITLYFWIEWHSVKFEMGNFMQEVAYISGVWKITFKDLVELIKKAPEHAYQQRVKDKKGNAKSSFVLDIRDPLFEKVI